MLRVVGIQKSDHPQREFVLLQNQGSMRVGLKGHVLISDQALQSGDLWNAAYAFRDEVMLPPGQFVLLLSGVGENHWGKTKDGLPVYFAFMNRSHIVWSEESGPIHVLSVHHTYHERTAHLLIR